ncbi:GspH/FimT family pseudopilin [Telmatospirillum sp.]|uniref:GspH/FimT family pseudopilin n=1 Tax=Telmatospirillum sp. TaxID=2079197 RepID=UPI0028477321|nr:GspH/FimT family pseudopilin [Telmatospirillum sp.]MDR3436567.1 GspH/FimT family pseudopilin [Telmatospirillum sp.]
MASDSGGRPERRPLRRDGGFTLIEIVVVLGILGLALALVLSYGTPRGGALALRAAATELAGGLREARSLAVAGNKPVAVAIDLTSHRWQIDGQDVRHLPEDMSVRLLTVAGETASNTLGRFRFFPDGSATGGRIEFAGANRRIQIGIDWLSGRVSLAEVQ